MRASHRLRCRANKTYDLLWASFRALFLQHPRPVLGPLVCFRYVTLHALRLRVFDFNSQDAHNAVNLKYMKWREVGSALVIMAPPLDSLACVGSATEMATRTHVHKWTRQEDSDGRRSNCCQLPGHRIYRRRDRSRQQNLSVKKIKISCELAK